MRSSALPLLFASLIAAAPTELDKKKLFPKCFAPNDPVYHAAQAMRGNQNGLKYCLDKILNVKPVVATVSIQATQNVQVTNTALNLITVTGGELGGTVTITAAPVTETETVTSTDIVTTTQDVCPVAQANKRLLGGNKGDGCPDLPILGFACEALSYACDCLEIPTPTITTTITVTAQVTAVVIQTVDVITAVPAIVTETPTSTETDTVTSTTTTCAVRTRPTAATCSPGSVCGNANFCTGSSSCICVITTGGFSVCGDTSQDRGCSGATRCTADTDCPGIQNCVTQSCCGFNICYPTSGCSNTALPARLFRRNPQAVLFDQLPPSFRPQDGQEDGA